MAIQMNLAELLTWGMKNLAISEISTPARDACKLLCHVTNLSTETLLVRGKNILAEDDVIRDYKKLIKHRCELVPIAYLTGKTEFMGLDFEVNKSVLIPRPVTETLVNESISVINRFNIKLVLDLCTGSGCVGISLAHICPGLRVVSSDISSEALDLAKKNALRLGVLDRMIFVKSDIFDSFSHHIMKDLNKKEESIGKFKLIASNPPYIVSENIQNLPFSVKTYEPISAVDGGMDGIQFYRRIFEDGKEYLLPGGVMLLQIDVNKKEIIQNLALSYGYSFDGIARDLKGQERVLRVCLG